MAELEELKILVDKLTLGYEELLKNQKVVNYDTSIQTVKKFGIFIESYGDEINDLKQDLETANFNKNLRHAINPESGFFKKKLSDMLQESLETNFKQMVTTAFKGAGVNGPITNESDSIVKGIVSTVNGAMNLPGIGQVINSNPYGAIIKEAVSTTSSLVLLISTAVEQAKQKKMLKEFYTLLPGVKNNILSNLSTYLEFYTKAQTFNDNYDTTLKVIEINFTTLYNRTIDLCITITTALSDAGLNVTAVDETKSIKEITQDLKTTLDKAFNTPSSQMLSIVENLEVLIKTQSLDLYQQYFTLAEERKKLESSFFNNFLALLKDYKNDANETLINQTETTGTIFIKGITDEIAANKKSFKEKLKGIYF